MVKHQFLRLTCIAFSGIACMVIPSLTWVIYPVIPKPCCNQFLKALIPLQTSEYTHYAAPPLWSPPDEQHELVFGWRRDKALSRGVLGERDILYFMETANTQTDLVPGSAVSQQHHSSLCMPTTCPAVSQDCLHATRREGLYWWLISILRIDLDAEWHRNKGK